MVLKVEEVLNLEQERKELLSFVLGRPQDKMLLDVFV